MFVFQFTFSERITCNSTAIVPVMARLMTAVTKNSSAGNGLEQIIFAFNKWSSALEICASKKLTFSTSSCLRRSTRESILRVEVLLEFDAVAVCPSAGQVCGSLLLNWSVHTSANLIFHFSYKSGKRTYHLSLSYLHISKYRKKEKKRKWSVKSIIFSFF